MSAVDTTWVDDQTAPGLLASLWQYRRGSAIIVGSFAALALLFAIVTSQLRSPSPSATARLVLTDPRGDSVFRPGNSAATDLQKHAEARAAVAQSVRVLERASVLLRGRYDADQLAGRVSTFTSADSVSVFISANGANVREARDIADAVAAAYQDVTKEDTDAEAERALKALDDNRKRLLANLGEENVTAAERDAAASALGQIEFKINEIALNAAFYGGGVDFVNRAVADAPPATNVVRYLAAGIMLGLLTALVVAWARAGWHRTVDVNEHAVALVGAPLLGEVPDLGGRHRGAVTVPSAMPAPAFEAVTASLLARRREGGVVLVTGAGRGDGATVTACSVAIALAKEGREVLLIDADPEGRGAQTVLGRQGGVGLAELARGLAEQSTAVTTVEAGHCRLDFLPPGGIVDDLSSIYRSDGAKRVLTRLALAYDLVIVDAPPLLDSAEAASLALHSDAVVAVVRRGTRTSTVEAFRSRIGLFPPPVIGVVFNRSRGPVFGPPAPVVADAVRVAEPVPLPSSVAAEQG